MGKIIHDKRLPADLHVYLNDFGEYVVCRNNKVFQFEDGDNVRCGKSTEEAVLNYLNAKRARAGL